MRTRLACSSLAVLMFTAACQPAEKPVEAPAAVEAPKPPPPPAKPKPFTADELTKFYNDCWGHFEGKAWDKFSTCYSPTVTNTQPGMPTQTNRDEAMTTTKGYATAFPDAKGPRQITMVNGNHVVSMVLFQGTHSGPMMSPGGEIAATNKKIGYMALHRIDMNDENVAQAQWWVSDGGTMMAQLGMNPSPARKVIDKGVETTELVVAKNDATETANLATLKKVYELFNAKDKALFEHMHNDVTEMSVAEPKDVKGKKSVMAHNQAFWKGFPDIKAHVEDTFAAGDYTYTVAHMTGTNTGPMPAMGLKKPTGKAVDFRYHEIVKWEGGKAKMVYAFMNGMEIATQLGLVPGPNDKAPTAKK